MLGLVTPCGEENAGAPHIMEKGLQPESPTLLSALCGNPTRTSVVQTELVADETAPVSIDFLGEEEPKRTKAKKESGLEAACANSKSTSEDVQSRVRRKVSVVLLSGDDREFATLPADVPRKIEIDYTYRNGGPPLDFKDARLSFFPL